MIATHFINQITHLSNIPPGVSKTRLDRKVDNLIDLIKLRIGSFSMDHLADSLREQVMDLRVFIVKNFEEISTLEYASGLNEYITDNIHSTYSELAETAAEVLLAQEKIFGAVEYTMGGETFGQIINYDLDEIKNRFPTFNRPFAAIRKWVDKSLDIELALLISQMVLNNEIQLKKGKLKELTSFMINTISSCGGHAIYLGIWEPDVNDDSRITRNMEMLASIYGVDYSRGYRINQEGQKIMIEA